MTLVAAIAGSAFEAFAAATWPPEVRVRPLRDRGDDVRFVVPAWGEVPDLGAMPRLEVVQVLSAGTDWIEDAMPEGVVLCRAAGARDAAVAEWVVGALLGAVTGLLPAARAGRWQPATPQDLEGSTVALVGFGGIARAVAQRLGPFGVTVVGVTRRGRDGTRTVDELPEVVAAADHVVNLLPSTPATQRLFDRALLARLRDGATFVNAGRGATVDHDALLAELRTGRLRAVLDVTDPEPLPDGHPLWSAPGLLAVTAHHAGDTPGADRRAAAFAVEQLRRFATGRPLEGVVAPAGRVR